MKETRSFYIKWLIISLVLLVFQWITEIGLPWRPALWTIFLVSLFFWLVPWPGRPLHMVFEKLESVTTEGMRFFTGMGIVLLLISFYRAVYLTLCADLISFPGKSSMDRMLAGGDQIWWALAALVLLIVGLVRPLADLAFRGWMGFARILQFVVSKIVLTLAYITTVLPVGLLARATGKKFLDKRFRHDTDTYWEDRPATEHPRKFYRHF